MKSIEYEYQVVDIRPYAIDTENMLNKFASEGWRVVCSYAHNNEWIVLERRKNR